MLVLSRRADQKIVFPSLGVTVQLLKINGQVARIGVDAPPGVRVLRDELVDTSVRSEPAEPAQPSVAHTLRNQLSKITLGLQLFRMQRAARQPDQADATLAGLFAQLDSLERQSAAGSAARPLRALLVEDDGNERELLAGVLGMNGCECATAADGDEALDYLATHARPDVVLLDMHMPRCDGPTALRAIRGNPKTADLKVIAVSGSSPQEMGVTVSPRGVDGWFTKPLNPRSLWDAVQQCVHSPAARN
jgi:carbon storage regulator CsrA